MHRSELVDFCFRIMSNLFVELGVDKIMVWIILSGESLFLTLVACGVIFAELGDKTNAALGDG